MEALFWVLAGLLFYTYAGYLGLLWVLVRIRGWCPRRDESFRPEVSLIVTAFNEERSIRGTLENALAQDYPSDRFQILVASDGSTDATEAIVAEFRDRGVDLVACPRLGKEGAKARAVERARGVILMFSDATSRWRSDAVRMLVRNFADPAVGCASGETRYTSDRDTGVSRGSGTYWDYEIQTKALEGALGRLVVVCGQIHAVRRDLYEPLPSEGSADMMVPLRVQELGFASVYEPEALAVEEPRLRVSEEVASRIRMSIRAFWILRLSPRFLNPLHSPKIAFFLVSHKVLRWIGPVLLIGLFLANLFLAGRPFYAACFVGQLLFYGLGLLGHAAARSGRKRFSAVHFFCLINWCALIGLLRFLRGDRKATWETIRTPEFRQHGGKTE